MGQTTIRPNPKVRKPMTALMTNIITAPKIELYNMPNGPKINVKNKPNPMLFNDCTITTCGFLSFAVVLGVSVLGVSVLGVSVIG